jgi:aldose sugar dehydrogenase
MRHLVAAAVLLSWLPLGACSPQSGPVTPSADAPEANGWRAETLVSGLEHPWGIAWMPDGAALVTERPGRLRVVRDGRLDPSPIAGVPEVLAHGQGGLLDLALHPRFAENRLVYLTLAEGTQDANRTASRGAGWGRGGSRGGGHLSQCRRQVRRPALRLRLLWLPDGSLLMSIGDGGNPPIGFQGENIRNQAQNPGTHFGKVLRLTEDGEAAPRQPLRGTAQGQGRRSGPWATATSRAWPWTPRAAGSGPTSTAPGAGTSSISSSAATTTAGRW